MLASTSKTVDLDDDTGRSYAPKTRTAIVKIMLMTGLEVMWTRTRT